MESQTDSSNIKNCAVQVFHLRLNILYVWLQKFWHCNTFTFNTALGLNDCGNHFRDSGKAQHGHFHLPQLARYKTSSPLFTCRSVLHSVYVNASTLPMVQFETRHAVYNMLDSLIQIALLLNFFFFGTLWKFLCIDSIISANTHYMTILRTYYYLSKKYTKFPIK